MDILSEVYYKSAAENERRFRYCEDYLQSLKNLDFSIYSDKLKVSTLVPIGSRISFRGEIKHTNEIIVALGTEYFVKCSLAQAEILRQHRIQDAQSKVDMFKKEKEYLENQMSLTKKTIYDSQGKEIIEYYSEEDDKAWRKEHRENVRKYKQNASKKEKTKTEDITDEELWNRLEELELQEELENELSDMNDHNPSSKVKESIQECLIDELKDYINMKNEELNENTKQNKVNNDKETKAKKVTFKETEIVEQPSKLDVLQQVIDKQNELEEKLFELKNREKSQTKTKTDLMSRLDELEQLDELEDEMDRLDNIIGIEDVEEEEEEEEDSNKIQANKLQRRVSFADDDDSKTIEITFKHSPTEVENEPYDPSKGIQKPSDIYVAHSNVGKVSTSILKKSKYDTVTEVKSTKDPLTQIDSQESEEHEIIVIKDVKEVADVNRKLLSQERPVSLFKKKRMQNKS